MKETCEEIIFDVLESRPESILVISIVDGDLYVDSNMTTIECLGALDVGRDYVKELLRLDQ